MSAQRQRGQGRAGCGCPQPAPSKVAAQQDRETSTFGAVRGRFLRHHVTPVGGAVALVTSGTSRSYVLSRVRDHAPVDAVRHVAHCPTRILLGYARRRTKIDCGWPELGPRVDHPSGAHLVSNAVADGDAEADSSRAGGENDGDDFQHVTVGVRDGAVLSIHDFIHVIGVGAVTS